ncbi:Uncharacterised protein [Vibrio cholerae]|nr:Uncharacterised protein [Vibrio cholerae]
MLAVRQHIVGKAFHYGIRSWENFMVDHNSQ